MDAKEFESLEPEKQAEIFHKSSFKDKGELLLHSHDPQGLTRSLSQEELYLLTKEVDFSEKTEVIRYANLPQLFFISDLECWKKDRISAQGFIRWLHVLLESDERRLLQWLIQMDHETVVSGFKKFIEVLKPDWEFAADEALGDIPYFTLDFYYYVYVTDEELEVVKRVFQVLFENARGKYTSILEGVIAEVESELEEDAFQKREMRLAERGFPDEETAHKIYRVITPKEFEAYPRKKVRQSLEPDTPIPDYPILWTQDRLFLDEALVLFRNDTTGVRDSLQEEIAWLSNKVIACEGIDFSSEENVKRGVERARDYVSIGLEILSGGDLNKAKTILSERWLEVVFRCAVSDILMLREQLFAITRESWKGRQAEFIEFLMPPYEFIVTGILKKLPEYHDPEIQDQVVALRDFKSYDELIKTRQAVEQLKAAHKDLKRLKVDLNKLHSLLAGMGTLFAHFVLSGKTSGVYLSLSDLKAFIEKAFVPKGPKRVLKAEQKEAFLNHFEASYQALMKPFWAIIFDQLEEDFARLELKKLDPRFITTICVKISKGEK